MNTSLPQPHIFLPLEVKEKHCIITGASRGMGRAIARRLASEQAFLHLLGRNPDTLAAVQAELQDQTGIVDVYPTDLSDLAAIEAFVEDFVQKGYKADILVQNAGMIQMGTVADCPPETLQKLFAVNLQAPYALAHYLMPHFNSDFAQILMVNSTVRAHAGLSQYAATKHALKSLTDSFRAEVNGRKIRVMSLYPGSTATSMIEKVYQYTGKPSYAPERLLQPEDIAHTVHHMLTAPLTAEITDLSIRPFLKS